MLRTTTLGSILLLAAPALAAPVPASRVHGHAGDELAYEELALSMLDDFGYGDANPDTFDFEEFLEQGFVRVRLGLFELYVPTVDLEQKSLAAELKSLSAAMLKAQAKWLEWLEPVAGEPEEWSEDVQSAQADMEQARADLKTLGRWVKSWKTGKLAAVPGSEQRDLLIALEPQAEVVEAAERFAKYMGTGAALGLELDEGNREPLILIEDRGRYVEFVCFAGWLHPDLHHEFWDPKIITWTNFYVDEYKVLALRTAAPGATSGDYREGWSLDERADEGTAQQITQLAVNSMLDNYFGEKIPPALAGGLALNLVIDIYGECNTRVDGDLSERRKGAREMFVPGGLSQGGILPPNLADSRWRADHQGSDRFLGILRTSQKNGAKKSRKASDKHRRFRLMDFDEVERTIIEGPFLGSAAADTTAPPHAFYGDHLEFLRSYRCAFVWWLQHRVIPKDKRASGEAFAKFLRELSQADDAVEIERVFEESFGGVPLSSRELEKTGDLEGMFLEWLRTKAR